MTTTNPIHDYSSGIYHDISQISGAASDAELAAHEADTTNVHGIVDSSDLVLKSGNLNQITTRSHTVLSDIGSNTHAQIDADIANTTAIRYASKEPIGFDYEHLPTITYDPTTRVVTLTGNHDFFIYGAEFNKTTTVCTAHADTTGVYYYFYDVNGTLTISNSMWDFYANVPLCYVIYNTTAAGTKGFVNNELHTTRLNAETRKWMHSNKGSYTTALPALTNFNITPVSPADTDNRIDIASMNLIDEDISNVIAAFVYASGHRYTAMYRSGTAWNWTENLTVPYTAGTYAQYNLISGGSGSLADITNGDFVNWYLVATNSLNSAFRYVWVPGQAKYATLALAQAANFFSNDLAGLPFAEFLCLYQVTWGANSSYSSTGKVRVAATPRVQSLNNLTSFTLQTSSHNTLSGRADANSHPAAAISFTAGGSIAATDVQTAIAEASSDLDAHIADTTDAHAGTAITNTPAGNISATTAQAAINELDTEKAGLATNNAFTGTNSFAGAVTMSDGTNTTTIVPPFRTDKSKCELLLDFDNTLIDKTRGITPSGYNTACRWGDAWINDNATKATATALGGTFKTFDGDRGKFGCGIAIEESRTNGWHRSLLQYVSATTLVVSTNSTYRTNNYTSAYADSYAEFTSDTTDLKDPTGGYNACKMKYLSGGGNNYFYTTSAVTNGVTYTFSAWVCGSGTYKMGYTSNDSGTLTATSNWQRVTWTAAAAGTEARFYVVSGTIYVYGIQVEAGSYATSFILTTNGAVTRPAGKIAYPLAVRDTYMSCWFTPHHLYTSDTTGYIFMYNLLNSGGSNNEQIGLLQVYSGGVSKLKFTVYDESTGTTDLYDVKTFASDAEWRTTHFVYLEYVAGSTTARVYLDGTMYNITVTARPGLTGTGNSLGLIGNTVAAYTFNNFCVFKQSMTEAELKQIYLSNHPVICDNAQDTPESPRTLLDVLGTDILNDGYPEIYKGGNICYIGGSIAKTASNLNSGDTILTVPSQYRPLRDKLFLITAVANTVYSAVVVRLYCSDGTLKLVSPNLTKNVYLIFEGMNYCV